jgi:flagellar biosynthetic protein FlhB
MADDTGDKTEKPSAQKLRKAREHGQSAKSKDLTMAIGIFASLKLLMFLTPGYLEDFRSIFAQSFASLDGAGTLQNAWSSTFQTAMGLLLKMLLPLFVMPLVGIVTSVVPGGFVFSSGNWFPKLSRMSPAANLKRLVDPKHFFELGTSIAKATVMIVVLVHVCRSSVDGYLHLQAESFGEAMSNGAQMMMDGVMALCMVFILFGLIDMPAQVFFFMRGQRMSKRDVKDEHKSNEGNPQVRQRIRGLQRQMAKRSARKTVPTADVVIVNPEHYAVALKYDENRAEAPFVVAKGVDEMAFYIREIATEHGIEVLPLPPLARAIYNTSQVHQQIPMPLYKVVAQVLTYVMQLKAFRTGRRAAQPQLPADLDAIPTHLSEPATA